MPAAEAVQHERVGEGEEEVVEEIYDLNEPANERVEADREPILEEYEADYAEETDTAIHNGT